VKWARDGARVYTAGRDSVINVWKTGSLVALTGPVDGGDDDDNDGGSKKRRAGSRQQAADRSGGAPIKELTIPVYETLESIEIARGRDGRDLVVCCGDGEVAAVWCPTSGRKIATTPASERCKTGFAAAVAIEAADGPALIFASRDHDLVVRDATILLGEASAPPPKGTADADLPKLPRAKLIVGFHDEVTDVVHVLGDTAAAVSTNSDVIHVMSPDTGATVPLHGHSDIVLSLSASKCGSFLASSSKDGTAIVWDISDAFSSTARIVPGAVLRGHAEAVSAVALSRRQPKAAGGGAGDFAALPPQPPMFVATGSSDRTIKVWDVPRDLSGKAPAISGSRATVFAHDKDINAIAVSPNDRVIASGSQDKTAKLWNAADLAPLGTLRGHKRGIWSLSFSPSDAVLATCSADKTIRLWSLRDNSCGLCRDSSCFSKY
jgi:WD40 repeat protein